MSLTFAWTALLGFQSIETLFFPKPPFQVCDLSSFFILTKYFLTASVFTGHTSLTSCFVLGIHCPWNLVKSDIVTLEPKATLLTFMGTSLLMLHAFDTTVHAIRQ
ncbi:hypothetical protein MTR_6g046030 [Medicago truncatula]|uniref:Uncharacterized protein n=1 Tax=Medicago truncatula TaxID=3880 RepID=G7KK71_MEDTR|nr:hypothetical protein MTR_6g046030 [Medicago truncatula]